MNNYIVYLITLLIFLAAFLFWKWIFTRKNKLNKSAIILYSVLISILTVTLLLFITASIVYVLFISGGGC